MPLSPRRRTPWATLYPKESLPHRARIELTLSLLEGSDEAFDELFEGVVAAVLCVPEKDAAVLRWRCGPDSPLPPVTILGVRDGDVLLGYVVLKVASGGDTGYVLGLMARPGPHDVARALLRQAGRHLGRLRVQRVRYRFAESCTSSGTKDLWRSGFFLGKRRQVLLVGFTDSSPHETANDTAYWSHSCGDGEGSYWITWEIQPAGNVIRNRLLA
jgi:hypothetical protein